jgi:patatin-like phospholipase/acyl hydrolase
MEPAIPQLSHAGAEIPKRFRLLSLDGGGIRGAFTASVLAKLEELTGCAVADYFDLIVGTSTGGILALGLGLGFSAEELCRFYTERGPRIFPNTGPVQRLGTNIRHLFAHKRSRAALAKELSQVFRGRRLGESKCRLVLPTFDAVKGRIFLLKTAHHPRFANDYRALAVDCALATAAAPTYFEASPFPEHPGVNYVDGGVWANCPAMVAVTEALAFLGARADQIDVLSIGTTSSPFHISPVRRRLGGIITWNKGLIDLMMRGQEEAANAQAKCIANSFLRINCEVRPGRFSLDNVKVVDDLIGLGTGEAMKRDNVDVVSSRFLNGKKIIPFVPVYKLK